MRVLLKIFYCGLELVSDEKQQSFSTRGWVALGFEYIAYVVVGFLLSVNAQQSYLSREFQHEVSV